MNQIRSSEFPKGYTDSLIISFKQFTAYKMLPHVYSEWLKARIKYMLYSVICLGKKIIRKNMTCFCLFMFLIFFYTFCHFIVRQIQILMVYCLSRVYNNKITSVFWILLSLIWRPGFLF